MPEVDAHRLCCEYDDFRECMGYLPEDDPMYDMRLAYCEDIHCDIVCLEEASGRDYTVVDVGDADDFSDLEDRCREAGGELYYVDGELKCLKKLKR